ncbi:high-affinity Zn(2+) transporter zrt1 [Phytophthora boehmeriae]|uniref:High-affinity Zn(2+) transporter zrt1 n=1 Tax=Phytophthora boehmeriae TaxID=109152 RepID=A0A8T1WSH9_9STRA|nr:high-affinity Zn(2+) transporter zrt1 [Phytophthora boehmeriae]
MEDVGLHIGAIFIIFAVSAAGTLVPVISKRIPQCNADSIMMEAISAFASGVVIATGLIHMINEGIEKLSDEALGPIVEEYECLGLAFVLMTLVAMHLIECESTIFFGSKGSMFHSHAHGQGHAHDHGHGHTRGQGNDQTLDAVVRSVSSTGDNLLVLHPTENSYRVMVPEHTPPDSKIRRKIATIIFEAGVIFHSIIIGVNLGVTEGPTFQTLLVALCFHQFFEGIAIGTAALGSIQTRAKVFMINFAFAITTPIGQVIGLSIRNSYSESSATSLWVQGILDCVAGGILLYTGLVELLTYNFTTNQHFLSRTVHQRFVLYFCLWMGAALMALLGKWA